MIKYNICIYKLNYTVFNNLEITLHKYDILKKSSRNNNMGGAYMLICIILKLA